MQVSTANDVKVYNLSSGRTLPEWISDRKKRALLKNDFGEPLSRLVSHVIPSFQSCDSGWSSSKTSPCLSPPRAYRCHVMASTSLLLVYICGGVGGAYLCACDIGLYTQACTSLVSNATTSTSSL